MALPSFRSRIRRTALALIVVLLASFSVLVYGGLWVLLYRHVDQELEALARAEASWIEIDDDLREFSGRSSISHHHTRAEEDDEADGHEDEDTDDLREAARSLTIRNIEGVIIWKGAAATIRPPLDDALREPLAQGTPVFDTLAPPDSTPTRRISYPFVGKEGTPYVLQAEASLGFVRDTLTMALALLGAIVTAAILSAWAGSGWLARQALTPIQQLSFTAEKVSGSSLSKTRAVLDAPYHEFNRLAEAFNGMLDRLQRMFDAQHRFVADASHELKTPLTAMKGHLEVALARARTLEDYREALLTILAEVERLISLTRSLLTLVQFAGDKPPIHRTPMSMEPLLREVAAELSVLSEERGIRLSVETESMPRILGDAGRLKQMVITLVDNALRYTPAGGRITIALAKDEGDIRLTVSDTGSGIAPEHLPHLFEPFYRPDTARAKDSGGAGLGLALVKEIAEAHGGYVQAESSPGEGSRFHVRIPALPA